jgi:hypothetical protein
MRRFQGSLDDLQDTVMRCAVLGEWSFHKKSYFYRFRTSTGAILNWWPTTGTISFQGHHAREFETLFIEHALIGVAQSEPTLVCEESAWQAVPDPTPRLDPSREAPSSVGRETRRKLSSPHSPRLVPRSVKLLASPHRD